MTNNSSLFAKVADKSLGKNLLWILSTGSFFWSRKRLKILMKDKRKSCMVRTEREREGGGWGLNLRLAGPRKRPVLEFLNNLWGLGPSRIRVVVPARQATQPGGI